MADSHRKCADQFQCSLCNMSFYRKKSCSELVQIILYDPNPQKHNESKPSAAIASLGHFLAKLRIGSTSLRLTQVLAINLKFSSVISLSSLQTSTHFA